jgi:tetratricopeptide (TPR) repeat protein
MKYARTLALFLLLPALPLHADEDLSPEQRMAAIEQKAASGDRRAAQREVESWKKKEGKAPWPWLAAANLSFQQKKYRRCLSEAQTALDKAPQNADAYYWRGRCFEAEGKALDAANEYRAALKAQAAHPMASEGLARVESAAGDGGSASTAN